MAQAVKLRAPVVLSFSKYIGTSTGVMPLTLPTSSTTNSTVNATAFGAGGTVNITGTGTSTTRGTTTSLIPYSVTRSDYVAVYLAKIKQRIGLYVKPLDDDTRRAIGTNSGVVVAVVVDGSPAFSADVFTGDIIISVDGVPIAGPDGWNDVLNSSGGRTVPVVIRRQSGTVTKMIAVNRL
ncbi:MAG: PDZ domain-containing protein [Burkholderiaceae bacterium]|nr:PDZ domain-containing protein [Burkholderiaceae bacterium]